MFPYSLPIVLPIQFRQFRIALELTDHIVVEGDEHAPADVIPSIALLRCQADLPDEIEPIPQRQQVQCVHRPQDHPDRHHIGVGVVVYPVVFLAGVARMELVGADDSPDRVAAAVVVKVGQAHPETCDLDQHLGSVVDEKLAITGHLIVLPRVVRDGEADMMCPRTGIRIPPAGLRIQVKFLAHFAPVTARLPGIHRAEVARPAGPRAGPREAADTDKAAATGKRSACAGSAPGRRTARPRRHVRGRPHRAAPAPGLRRRVRRCAAKWSAAGAPNAAGGPAMPPSLSVRPMLHCSHSRAHARACC